MSKRSLFALFALLLPFMTIAQTHPAENARLHYRIIGFTFPEVPNAASYTVEIAQGNHKAEATFGKNILVSVSAVHNKVIAEVPYWGADYTWRVVAKGPFKDRRGRYNHFTTLNDLVVLNNSRLSIIDSAVQFEDGFVLADINRCMYDMKGNIVWFLPSNVVGDGRSVGIEDMKMTDRGTISFLSNSRVFEVNYDGDTIAMLPPRGGEDLAPEARVNHHEATRLSNGHFMSLYSKVKAWRKINGVMEIKPVDDTSGGYQISAFDKLIEYDTNGKIVWEFDLFNYIFKSDMANWLHQDGKNNTDLHPNAFWFDEENKVVYIGLKHISRILKVAYPSGIVQSEFGKKYSPGDRNLDQSLFCQQHTVRVRGSEIFVFNNNSCANNAIPKLMVLREDKTAEFGLSKVWEYELPVTFPLHNRSRGGNITELEGGAIFGSASSPNGDVLIVDRASKVLWRGRLEKREVENGSWREVATYRASFIPTRRELERMVFFGGSEE